MKIKRLFPAAAAALCLCFSSCSAMDFFSVDSLIRAPKLTGEYSVLQTAFENSVGKDTVPVVPVAGAYRSSYVMTDFDGDGIDEALALYSRSDADTVTHINLLSYSERSWISLGDVSGSGAGIYEISFCDINGDGMKEFAVLWNQSDPGAQDKTMTVYSVSADGKTFSGISSLATVQTDSYLMYCFDGEGADALFYTCHKSPDAGGGLYAQMLDFGSESGVANPVTRVDFYPDVQRAAEINCEKTDFGTRIYVDCLMADGTYTTEILDYSLKDAAFSVPLKNAEADADVSTARKAAVTCRDIDGDGAMEIPADITFADGSVISGSAGRCPVSVIEWKSLDGDGLTGKTKYFINHNDGYRMCIDRIYDTCTVRYDEVSRTARWYASDPSSGFFDPDAKNISDDILFSVIYSSRNDDNGKDGDYLVVVTKRGEEMNIRPSFVKSLIETD